MLMSSRTTKVLTFSVPPAMADEFEQLALEKQSTKSEMFREMLRVYRSYRKHRPEPEISEALAKEVNRNARNAPGGK
jgi:metal-responsive CopG/Arc/MetJ family transcriptional regulator